MISVIESSNIGRRKPPFFILFSPSLTYLKRKARKRPLRFFAFCQIFKARNLIVPRELTTKSSQASLFVVPRRYKLASIRQLNHEPKNLVGLDQVQWHSQQDIRQIKMHWRSKGLEAR